MLVLWRLAYPGILVLEAVPPLPAQGLPLHSSSVTAGGTAATTMTVTITNPNGLPVSGISDRHGEKERTALRAH